VIVEHLTLKEVVELKERFKLMDNNNRGKINIDELQLGFHKISS